MGCLAFFCESSVMFRSVTCTLLDQRISCVQICLLYEALQSQISLDDAGFDLTRIVNRGGR